MNTFKKWIAHEKNDESKEKVEYKGYLYMTFYKRMIHIWVWATQEGKRNKYEKIRWESVSHYFFREVHRCFLGYISYISIYITVSLAKRLCFLEKYSIIHLMKIQDARFIKSISIHNNQIFLEERNEIVFVGRSNVGKSSLMNTLMQKKDLVKTSSKPGKTRTANLFLVNEKYHFTDLPGYGFAKLGQDLREDLDALISWYLEEKRYTIKQVVLLCDAKIGPQQSDIDMHQFITELGLAITVVMSKVDRLSKSEVSKSLSHAEKIFFWARILPISSTKRQWTDELRKILWESLRV